MERAEILVRAVHHAWYACSKMQGESPVSWADMPEWRRNALEHTVGFWESWESWESCKDLDFPSFLAVTQLTWVQFHRRHHWAHTELLPYVSLPADQQKKLLAMLKTYILFRELTQ